MKLRWKILITVALAFLASYLFGATKHHEPTRGQLTVTFAAYNEEYFYGVLPKNTKIDLVDLSKQDWMGVTNIIDGRYVIEIDPKVHPLEKLAELTLIHEMCHEENMVLGKDTDIDKHGEKFQSCMLRIAQAGGFKDLW